MRARALCACTRLAAADLKRKPAGYLLMWDSPVKLLRILARSASRS